MKEKWKEIRTPKGAMRYRYAISNMGRLTSFTNSIGDGKILNGTNYGGYLALTVRPFGELKYYFIHKLVAKHFLRSNRLKKFIIHYNYDKLDNRAANISWATKGEWLEHKRLDPSAKKHDVNLKLSIKQIQEIKAIFNNLDRTLTMKELAAKYGITKDQLYNIKIGKHWGYVK